MSPGIFIKTDSKQLILLTYEMKSYFLNAVWCPWNSGFIPGSYDLWYLCKVAVTDGTLQSGASVTPDKTLSWSPIRKDFGHPAWN